VIAVNVRTVVPKRLKRLPMKSNSISVKKRLKSVIAKTHKLSKIKVRASALTFLFRI
jgi:hypothetical protein